MCVQATVSQRNRDTMSSDRQPADQEQGINASESVSAAAADQRMHILFKDVQLRREHHSANYIIAPCSGTADQKHDKVRPSKETTLRSNWALSSVRQQAQTPLQEDAPVLLQWGSLKRRRCSRGPNNKHHPIRPYSDCLVDETSNSVPEAVHAAGDPNSLNSTHGNAVSLVKEISKPNNSSVVRKRGHPCSSLAAEAVTPNIVQDNCTWEKKERQSNYDSRPPQGQIYREQFDCRGNEGSLHAHPVQTPCEQEEGLPQCVTCNSPRSKKSLSPKGQSHDLIEPARKKSSVLPKFSTMRLSRKEQQEDMLLFRGRIKPSQRPKRRSRTVETALLCCTPGNFLPHITSSRYNVREKFVKEKPRGLKAMRSIDFDSE